MATAPADLSRMIPGLNFLEDLAKGAGASMPSLGAWVAPTLDPQELGKRIEELKTVQFWLEQNAKMIATTVQALEVQRMTLSTLKSLNVQMGDLAQAFSIPTAGADSAPSSERAASSARGAQAPSASSGKAAGKASTKAARAGAPEPAPVVDPMQWWGALTQQFSQLAANTLRDSAKATAPRPESSAASAAATPRERTAPGAGQVGGAASRKGGKARSPDARQRAR